MFLLIGLSLFPIIFLKTTKYLPEAQLLATTKNPLGEYDNFAIALKSGKETALSRTPVQFSTFLLPLKNLILIGDGDIQVGEHKMINVFKGLYKSGEKLDSRDQSSQGWVDDAHKNLPGFKVLYDTYPDADWFIMIDDDTFVFFDNLKKYLSNFNSDQEYYIGSPNEFKGCDGVSEFGKGPLFAQGGAGIVLSRAAVKKMMLIVDDCILKYQDCWAGDIRTGLCLRDAGISIDQSCGSKFRLRKSCAAHRFFVDPPEGEVFFDDACTEPLTFHHLNQVQIKNMYEFEMKHRNNRVNVNMELIAHHYLNDANTSITGKTRFGNYFSKRPVGSAFECKLMCHASSKCVSYTFSSHFCYLRATIPFPRDDPTKREVSGVVLDHFKCKKGWF